MPRVWRLALGKGWRASAAPLPNRPNLLRSSLPRARLLAKASLPRAFLCRGPLRKALGKECLCRVLEIWPSAKPQALSKERVSSSVHLFFAHPCPPSLVLAHRHPAPLPTSTSYSHDQWPNGLDLFGNSNPIFVFLSTRLPKRHHPTPLPTYCNGHLSVAHHALL